MRYILDTDWQKLAEEKLSAPVNELPTNNTIVHCHLDEIADFFRLIETSGTKNKYVVISSRSDYGLEYQEEDTVANDMSKVVHFNPIKGNKYEPLIIPPRCDQSKCKLTDRYIIKMYQWSCATFNYIPENIVKWYVVNSNIQDDRIVNIPFGINETFFDTAWDGFVNRYDPKDSFFPCYVNFSPNNLERAALSSQLKNYEGFFCNKNVSTTQFVIDMMTCNSVLCPPGNGLDSYRMLETIYLGKLPVVLDISANILSAYEGLQFISLGMLTNNEAGMWPSFVDYKNSKADLNYWINEFKKDKDALLCSI